MILDEGICISFDQHLGIKNAITNWPRGDDGRTRVFHRYCLRHVASNFNTHFQNSTLKSAALRAGYASQVVKFYTIMETIKEVEIEAIRNKKKLTGKDGKEENSLHCCQSGDPCALYFHNQIYCSFQAFG